MDPSLEDYTAALYKQLQSNKSLRSLYLPHSDVYYARNAIYNATGVWLSCPEVQKLMKEEFGWNR